MLPKIAARGLLLPTVIFCQPWCSSAQRSWIPPLGRKNRQKGLWSEGLKFEQWLPTNKPIIATIRRTDGQKWMVWGVSLLFFFLMFHGILKKKKLWIAHTNMHWSTTRCNWYFSHFFNKFCCVFLFFCLFLFFFWFLKKKDNSAFQTAKWVKNSWGCWKERHLLPDLLYHVILLQQFSQSKLVSQGQRIWTKKPTAEQNTKLFVDAKLFLSKKIDHPQCWDIYVKHTSAKPVCVSVCVSVCVCVCVCVSLLTLFLC